MRTARRYIYWQILKAVAFITVSFLALFAFFDALNDLAFTSRTAIPYGWRNSFIYVGLLLPGHAYELLPIAVLIGTIFVMASLAQSSEFTILRTSGLGPWMALRNLLWLGAFFAVFTFLVGDYLTPRSEKAAQFYKAQFEGNVTAGRTGAWIKENVDGLDRIVNVQELTPDGQMRNIRIFDFDAEGFLTRLRKAESGTFVQGGWQLANMRDNVLNTPARSGVDQQQHIAHTTASAFLLQTDIQQSLVAAALLKPDRMSTYELYRYVSHLKANAQSAHLYELEFWRKLLYPLTCLVMTILALPFAYLHFRSGNITTAVFIGVIVGISFFMLNNVFGYIGNINAWTPWLVAAAPCLIYMLGALLTFRWLVLHR